jgi:bacteriorhodopsin
MIEITAYSSLFIQFITGVIDVSALSIDVPSDKMIFKDLLKVELVVQLIEFVFYLWMILNLTTIKNITPYRYLDWFITTPIMLITFIAYLDNNQYTTLSHFIFDNILIISELVFLNMLMLLFGFLAELNIIPYTIGITLGFIPFIYYFKRIYDIYIKKNTSNDKVKLYWFFLIIWTIYGIAALTTYTVKNTMYNMLDLFSKNGFGLFLVYVLWTHRIKN